MLSEQDVDKECIRIMPEREEENWDRWREDDDGMYRKLLCPFCGKGDRLYYRLKPSSKRWRCGYCGRSFPNPSGNPRSIDRAISSIVRTKKQQKTPLKNRQMSEKEPERLVEQYEASKKQEIQKMPRNERKQVIEHYEARQQIEIEKKIIFARRVIIGAAIMLAATIIVAIIFSV